MQPANDIGEHLGLRADKLLGRLSICRLDELHFHPSYVRLGLTVPASRLSALAQYGELAFREPLTITAERMIIDGYTRFELARHQGRKTLFCIECAVSEEEALRWLLHRHCRSNSRNDFLLILLALELEPLLRSKAELNQRFGGQYKGSSKLTEAERVDVRSEIAAAAGVGTVNVFKVKQILATAGPELLQALRNGEIHIHRGWLLSKTSLEEQRDALWRYQSERGIRKAIRTLVSRHRPKSLQTPPEVDDLIKLLSAFQSGKINAVTVVAVDIPGRAVFVTEELLRSFGAQKELALTCLLENR